MSNNTHHDHFPPSSTASRPLACARIKSWLNPVGDRAFHASGFWLVMTYLLTTVHHVYSSTIIAPDTSITGAFAGSWRAHGFLVFLVPVLVGLAALFGYRCTGRRLLLHGYCLVGGVIFTGIIGVWEGGWNHLVKLVVFALGWEGNYVYGPSWLTTFPSVQAPKDVFFEATGVLTLVFGLINAWFLYRLVERDRKAVGAWKESASRSARVA